MPKDAPPPCLCGHPFSRHFATLAECNVRGCPCESYRPAPSEAAFQRTVTELLRLNGFKVFSVRHSAFAGKRMDAKGRPIWVSDVTENGFPDIIAVKGKRIAAWELKSMKGKVTPEQEDWLRTWANAGANVGIIRPNNFDEIERWAREA